MDLEATLRAFGLERGFSRIGFCRVEPGETITRLREWLEQGMHGRMQYMENPRRESPDSVLAGVRTMVVAALNYRWPDGSDQPQEGMISRYAWGTDYHAVMLPMLESLARRLQELAPDSAVKAYVDTGPIAEKYWAQKAGIGWIGKHTNVLSQQGSSWFFLGVILTDASLSPDTPAEDHCGSCSRCIEACPTGAIVAPYVLDARLCISYLTIELRESIPRDLRPMIGHRILAATIARMSAHGIVSLMKAILDLRHVGRSWQQHLPVIFNYPRLSLKNCLQARMCFAQSTGVFCATALLLPAIPEEAN